MPLMFPLKGSSSLEGGDKKTAFSPERLGAGTFPGKNHCPETFRFLCNFKHLTTSQSAIRA
jgi:hypothetical protein